MTNPSLSSNLCQAVTVDSRNPTWKAEQGGAPGAELQGLSSRLAGRSCHRSSSNTDGAQTRHNQRADPLRSFHQRRPDEHVR